MRKLIILLLAILILGTSPLGAAEPAPLTPAQIARLESLCRVWGVVKFFHPWIVAPPDDKPIDWDAALVETIPLVEKATSAEEFRLAIGHMLSALNDQATRAEIPNQVQAREPAPAAEPGLPETKVVEASGKKILVIDATDWGRLAASARKSPSSIFEKPFAAAADTEAIVLDLRRTSGSQNDANTVVAALRNDIALLLKTDVTLAASRSRFHSGYAPEQGPAYGGYHSGFTVAEPSILQAKPGPSAGKRLIVLSNAGTSFVPPLLAALQSIGQAVVLHHANGSQVFAPDATYSMIIADGVVAQVRTADSINADGTFGLTPDYINEHNAAENGDGLMVTALAIASGQTVPPPRSLKRLPSAPLHPTENLYPEMTFPSREYRLLGLFRVWNVMHYFFPYKHLMDRSWDSVLFEFIPRFAEAENPADYGLVAREFVAHLQDSHVNAFGGAVNASVRRSGAASPLMRLHTLRGEMVIIAIDDSLKDKVKIGDVVLEVDGETVATRMDRLKKYVAASTPQSLESRLTNELLRGPTGSPATLKLRDTIGSVRDETVPRPPVAQVAGAIRALNEAMQRKTPVFSVLPEGYGYFDLVRLTVQQVDTAFDAVKDTPALIMDMRGYPKGTAWAICARLTDTPMHMAMFYEPYWTSPDTRGRAQRSFTFLQPIDPSPLWKYKGRIAVLINEDAVSQSEHSCLGFEEAAKGRITFIGTPTNGANGDVTNTSMPGGIRISFSGHDVRHADGRQLQRVGIQPDIRVEPTIAGIVAGKDEVLEAAIRFLNESKGK